MLLNQIRQFFYAAKAKVVSKSFPAINKGALQRTPALDAAAKNVVRLSGVPSDWDERHLQKYFDPYIKSLDKVILGRDSVGQSNHVAFFVFQKPEEADKFVERYHRDFINSSKDIESVKAEIFQPTTSKTKLRVLRSDLQVELYNLPFEATNLDVITIAERYGKISEIQMPMRCSSLNKGYCLLTFENGKSAKEFCNEIGEYSLFGRSLKARQKYISFDTQKPRQCSKSDAVFEKAETPEITIKGALFQEALKLAHLFEPEAQSSDTQAL